MSVKIIKLLEKNILTDRDISIEPYDKESEQYKMLLKDLYGDKDINDDCLFKKKILPLEYPLENIFDKEIERIITIAQDIFMFDITDTSFFFSDFIKYAPKFYELLIKGAQGIIIITRSDDKLSLDVLEQQAAIKDFFNKLKNEKKVLWVVKENGEIFHKGIEPSKERCILAKHFLRERVKCLLTNPENYYYGHYEVSSGIHARIFQDFYGLFTHKSEVIFNFLLNQLEQELDKHKFTAIVTFGYPHNPFQSIGGRIAQVLGVKTIALDSSISVSDATRDIEGKSKILLVTDAIYSSTTAKKILKEMQSFNITKFIALTGTKEANLSLGVESKILVPLELPWWRDKHKCDLCKAGLKPMRYKDDFEKRRDIDFFLDSSGYLDSYDFYDFTKKSSALLMDITSFNRNYYKFYFDTSKLFLKFGMHFARIIKNNLYKNNCGDIEYIVCPEDGKKASILLSIFVSDVIQKETGKYIPVIPIERNDIKLYKDPEKRKNLKLGQKYSRLGNRPILIIDDGMNTQRTLQDLQGICTIVRSTIVSTIVFLNRLSFERTETIRRSNPNNLDWVYHWPSSPFKKGNYPYDTN